MTTLINKESTQHYANKMVLAENRKVGSKSLPAALNEIDALIDEMKTYFDAEYGSALDMKLENNKNVFSVGTGTNVDKRSEVENSFTDVELSGNSLVNITHPLYPMHIKWTHEGTWQSKFIMYADAPNINTNSAHKKVMFNPKDKTTYTIVCNVIKNTSSGNVALHNAEKTTCMFKTHMHIKPSDVGILKFVQTADYSGLDMSRKDLVVLRTQSSGVASGEIEITDIMILEGDYTNKPIPQYFEGLKSIGEKEDGNHKISISSTGKNLCPYNNAEFQANETRPWVDMLGVEGIYGGSNVANRTRTWFYLSEGKYKLSYKTENCIIQVINKNENLIDLSKNFKGGYVCIRIKSNTTSGTYSVKDLQIELSETQTHYEPYKENKKEISLNEPLRGLPNGVRDTIEKINGEWKIVRRCIQIDLNGTEYWTHENPSQEDGVNTVLFSSSKILNAKDFPQLCDRFIAKKSNLMLNSHPDSEGVGCWSAKNNVNIRINKSRLSTIDSAGFKTWLSQNPTKVLFELATPIIEDISPITLQCWKNGVISINDVLPVETNHTVALNKSAQIKNNIKELTTLRKRVEDLESFYDKIALEQAYQLDLVNHSYELDYNR